MSSDNPYDRPPAVRGHLLLHYGTPEQLYPPAALSAPELHCFPAYGVIEPLGYLPPGPRRRALDLGCSVGRSTFELRRFYDEVVGLDLAESAIQAARTLQRERRIETKYFPRRRFRLLGVVGTAGPPPTGEPVDVTLELPPHLVTDGIQFMTGDATALDSALGKFDLVHMGRLLDRLSHPARCLAGLGAVIEPGGWLIHSCSYDWNDQFTPFVEWLRDNRPRVEILKQHLEPDFILERALQLPLLVDAAAAWCSWWPIEVTLWRRR